MTNYSYALSVWLRLVNVENSLTIVIVEIAILLLQYHCFLWNISWNSE